MGSVARRFGLVILVATLSLSMLEKSEGKGYEEAVNCRQFECAPYEVIHSQEEYEIRTYRNAMWVSTSPINSSSYKDAVGEGFNTLFEYIQGNNNQGAKINMTAPVLVDIFPSAGPVHNSSFVVHFYMPQKYQENYPLSHQTHPVRLPKHRYAVVRRFGGFMDDANIPAQLLALKKSLSGTPWRSSIANKHQGNTRPFSVAGYNSPYERENRVNEVILWFDNY